MGIVDAAGKELIKFAAEQALYGIVTSKVFKPKDEKEQRVISKNPEGKFKELKIKWNPSFDNEFYFVDKKDNICFTIKGKNAGAHDFKIYAGFSEASANVKGRSSDFLDRSNIKMYVYGDKIAQIKTDLDTYEDILTFRDPHIIAERNGKDLVIIKGEKELFRIRTSFMGNLSVLYEKEHDSLMAITVAVGYYASIAPSQKDIKKYALEASGY